MKYSVQTVDIQTSERVIISAGGVQVRAYSVPQILFNKSPASETETAYEQLQGFRA